MCMALAGWRAAADLDLAGASMACLARRGCEEADGQSQTSRRVDFLFWCLACSWAASCWGGLLGGAGCGHRVADGWDFNGFSGGRLGRVGCWRVGGPDPSLRSG